MKNMLLYLCLFDLLWTTRFKIRFSKKSIKLILIMKKKNVIKLVLTIVKYGITLILGYLGGSSETISDVVSSL